MELQKGPCNSSTAPKQPQLVLVTGYSGAGKSTVLRMLEDLGFFCVDNLPVPLLDSFFSLFAQPVMQGQQIALGLDARGGTNIQKVIIQLDKDLQQLSIPVKIFFLMANHAILLKRFQETRRMHPLAKNQSLSDAISSEQQLLRPLVELSDITLDTSQLSIHDLRKFVYNSFSDIQKPVLLANLISFGFKYGIPIESNYIFDVRSLPNPYFVAHLKELNGTQQAIQDYLFAQKDVTEYWTKLLDFIHFSLKKSYSEGRYFMNIAVGCTGGRHRSVAFVHKLAQQKFDFVQFLVLHRDMQKAKG